MNIEARPTGFFRRFARDRRGVGAVEFALIAPVLILLYLGGCELSIALTVNRKVQHAASTINDLVTQSAKLEAVDIDGIFNIAEAIIAPYDPEPLKIRATSVSIDADGRQRVEWSHASETQTALAKGSTYALPPAFSTLRDQHIIVVQTEYHYVPVTGSAIMSARDLGGTSYLNPRSGNSVDCQSC